MKQLTGTFYYVGNYIRFSNRLFSLLQNTTIWHKKPKDYISQEVECTGSVRLLQFA
jgi:hypothetical protein